VIEERSGVAIIDAMIATRERTHPAQLRIAVGISDARSTMPLSGQSSDGNGFNNGGAETVSGCIGALDSE